MGPMRLLIPYSVTIERAIFVTRSISFDATVVTYLVIGGNSFLTLANDATFACRACHHAINGLFHLAHADPALVTPRRQNSRLIQQVREIGAGHTRCLFRQRVKLDTGFQWLAF